MSAAAQALLVLGPPLPLTDVFNYERLRAHGRAARAEPLPRAAGRARATTRSTRCRTGTTSPAPTARSSRWLSEALVPFGAHGWLWAWKVVVLAGGVATVALVGAIAARLGVSPARAIAGFGLSPLLLIAEVGGLHNDVPAMLCLVAAAWCLVRGRDAGAPAAGSIPPRARSPSPAAGIKPSFAIVVGMVVLGARHRPRAIAGAARRGDRPSAS